MCGVSGAVIARGQISEELRLSLFLMQSRGPESAGMVIKNRFGYWNIRKMGKVDEVFDAPLRVEGEMGIGHVRYSTTGKSTLDNAQPIEGLPFQGAPVWLAHNGNLVNTAQLKAECVARGYRFSTSTDTEIIAALIHFSEAPTFIEALKKALHRVEGTYALTILHDGKIYGARDPTGNRPLILGQGRDMLFLCSESAVYDVMSLKFLREVSPGEIIILHQDTMSFSSDVISEPLAQCKEIQKPCIFEYVYLSRPDSRLNNGRIQMLRARMGEHLWREAPVEANIIVPTLDSGMGVSIGLERASRLPLTLGLFRFHYVGRTFLEPTDAQRDALLRVKLNVIPEEIEGKRVVLGDDSLVRGRTMKKLVALLMDFGAKEVHVRIGSPPYAYPCHYGINTNEIKDELAARRNNGDIEKIRQEIGATSLHYLSLEGMKQAVVEGTTGLKANNFCDACFSGNYHIGNDTIQVFNRSL